MAAALASAVFLAAAAPAKAGTSVGVDIQIGDPYRGASISFRSEPDVVVVPATKVYYVQDYDCDLYRYGKYWYFVEEGRWYRAKTYRGPFAHIHVTSVPRSVLKVPPKYRRNWHGPPRHAAAHGHYKNKDNGKGGKKHRGHGR
jgi:hypothetical protein